MKIFKGMLRGAMGIGTETNQVLSCFLKKTNVERRETKFNVES